MTASRNHFDRRGRRVSLQRECDRRLPSSSFLEQCGSGAWNSSTAPLQAKQRDSKVRTVPRTPEECSPVSPCLYLSPEKCHSAPRPEALSASSKSHPCFWISSPRILLSTRFACSGYQGSSLPSLLRQRVTPAEVSVDARRLFDGMPPQKKGKGAVPPASGGGGGINALPDGVIHHILGFLDANEAVQTCVLARRWRHLWRSASSLRIGCWSFADVSAFLEHLLLLRAGSPLDTFELKFLLFEDSDKPRVNLWLRYALLCKARMLNFGCNVSYINTGFQLDDLPLVSQHLRILELCGVVLNNRTCDFLSCPSLEHLHIVGCHLPCVRKISSNYLEHLSFTSCFFNQDQRFRTLIYAPRLVSLKLDAQLFPDGYLYRTPVLDIMPSLKKAFVRIAHRTADRCTHVDSGNCGHDNCNSCYGTEHENSSSCVLLEGLSEAENLSLIVEFKTFIFKRDLKQCPMFSKLRTLFRNDYWCVAPDFHELNCILKHSPVLEKLTLHLFPMRFKPKLRIKGRWNPSKVAAAISGHLKIVESQMYGH